MEPVPKKRGRGRPRKIVPEPVPAPVLEPVVEEVEVIQLDGGDLSDIARHVEQMPEPVPAPEPEPVEPEIIQLPPPAPIPGFHTAKPVESNDVDKKKEVLQKIRRYRESFEAVRAMRGPSDDASLEALEAHLETIRVTVSCKNTHAVVKGAYTVGVKGVEILTTKVGMKTYGLSQMLSQSGEVDSILKELECEIGLGHVPPMQRLFFVTLSSAIVLDGANRRAEILGGFKKAEVSQEVAGKYKDL